MKPETEQGWTVVGSTVVGADGKAIFVCDTNSGANHLADAHNAALAAEWEKYRKEMETVTMNTSDIETVQQLRSQLAAEWEKVQALTDSLTQIERECNIGTFSYNVAKDAIAKVKENQQ